MPMNQHIVKGKWTEIKGDIQKAWGKLTNDELEKTKGDIKTIRRLIETKYGKLQDKTDEKISEIFKRFDNTKDSAIEKMKKKVRN